METYSAPSRISLGILDMIRGQLDGAGVQRRQELLGKGDFSHVGELAVCVVRIRVRGVEGRYV